MAKYSHQFSRLDLQGQLVEGMELLLLEYSFCESFI